MSDYNPDADPRSSNSLIRAYLASKGLPANGGNVRIALSGNAANPGMIPGLVNSTPSTEADDQAAMAAAAGRSSGGGGRGIPTPPVPPGAPAAQQDSAPGAETRVGGTGAGGSPNTSAAPTSGGGGGPPSGDELNSALLATAILGSGAGAGLLTHMWQNRAGASAPAPGPGPRVAGVPGPGGQFSLPLEGGSGVAPPRQGELPLQGGGPRVNQPELPLTGGGGPAQGDLFGPRGQPTQAPPITVQSAPPGQPITTLDQFRAANPGASIPVPEPAVVPPGPTPAPLPPQPIQTPDQFRAANPATGGVPPAEVAPTGARIRKPRAPRIRLP